MTQKFNDPVAVKINGVEYPSIGAAARGVGVSRSAIGKLVARRGRVVDDYKVNLAPKSIPFEYQGVKYPSISAAADAYGIERNKMIRYYHAEQRELRESSPNGGE
jgi:hypothetical protein